MAMPQPGPQHQVFKIMEGVWTGQDKMHPSPWAPEGSVADGRTENRVALGGFAVIQDYAQIAGGQIVFEGHGVLTYDAAQQQYVMHWWDSMGEAPNVFRGSFEGGRLSLIGPSMSGQARVTWDFPSGDTYNFSMEVSPDGTQWAPAMDGRYRKTA